EEAEARGEGRSGAQVAIAAATAGSAEFRSGPFDGLTPWSRRQLRYAWKALPPPPRCPKLGRTLAHACWAASQVPWSTPGGADGPNPPPKPPPPPKPRPDGRTPEGRSEGRARPEGMVIVTPCWRRQSAYAWKAARPPAPALAGVDDGVVPPPHAASR